MRISRPVCLFLLAALCLAGFYFGSTNHDTKQISALLPEPEIKIPATTEQPASPSLHASYACVMDGHSLRTLYGKDSEKKAPMASTTKIMTALLVLESGQMNDTVTASARACSMPKVHLGMRKGEQFQMIDLLHSLMLESHNDTAVAIAEHMAGSVKAFAAKMNEKAKILGMSSTHFVTPNGLDEGGHGSTAADMCRLAAYAVQNKEFLNLIQTKSYRFSNVKGTRTFSLTNRDAFLSYYDGALGIKTGFTNKAGYCFVGAARRDGVTLTSCVLASGWPPNKSYKWTDTKQLMDYGFQYFYPSELPLQDLSLVRIPVEDGKKDVVSCVSPEKAKTLLSRFDTLTIRYDLPEKLYAPIHEQTRIGTVSYYINDTLFRKDSVFPSESIEKSDFSDTINVVLNLWMELFV